MPIARNVKTRPAGVGQAQNLTLYSSGFSSSTMV